LVFEFTLFELGIGCFALVPVFCPNGCRIIGPRVIFPQLVVPLEVPYQGGVRQESSDPGDLLSVDRLRVESQIHCDRFPPLVKSGRTFPVKFLGVFHFQP